MPIIIRFCGRGDASRAALIRCEVNAVHDDTDDPSHLLGLIACAATTAQAVERLRAEQEVRCLTLAKLCHNLRSPLHVIQGYTEVLREDPAAQEFNDILDRVGCATEAAIRQLHDYLARVRFEVADPVVRRELVNVDQLVAELQTRAAQQIGSRGVRLATRVPFSGACIQTDRDKLRGILLELLSNAIKFTPMGTVTLDVRTVRECTAFVMTDQGPGISEPELAALFNPFRQRPDEAVASLPGQGIGLAIARRLSALIGAGLAVERGGDGGAMFTLTVPAPMFVEVASVVSAALH
jgi:signal transduction histidine kinase